VDAVSDIPRPPSSLDRRAVVAELLRDRGELLVVSGLGAATWDAAAAGDHDANFYLWGAMGGAAMIGLGLALAQPARSVLVITGDGEQLMGLGSLATIAAKRPGNLTIAVLDNGRYGETGMQISHTGLGVRLDEMAAAAGFEWTAEIEDMMGVGDLRERTHHLVTGPRFANIRIEPEELERVLPIRDGVEIKNRFRAALGLG
jgi:thiamine pyrophosphate-dependent acetolactate synthase large subunit-like protein